MLEKPRLKKAEPIVNKVIESRLSNFRVRLLEKFPSQTEGIDIERMKKFFEDRGLRTADIVFLSEEQEPSFSDTTRTISKDHTYEEFVGLYFQDINLASVVRNKQLENHNGDFVTESLAVHELAHSTSTYRGFNYDITQNGTRAQVELPRIGFENKNEDGSHSGSFFEEGFADYMRSTYAAAYMPENAWNNIIASMRQKNPGASPTKNNYAVIDSNHGNVYIPTKYYFLNKSGEDMTTPSAIAGAGIDLLALKYPDIEVVLIEARNSVEGLRKFAKMVNDISPGLYTTLRRLQYNENDFKLGNALIAKAVGVNAR